MAPTENTARSPSEAGDFISNPPETDAPSNTPGFADAALVPSELVTLHSREHRIVTAGTASIAKPYGGGVGGPLEAAVSTLQKWLTWV